MGVTPLTRLKKIFLDLTNSPCKYKKDIGAQYQEAKKLFRDGAESVGAVNLKSFDKKLIREFKRL